MVAHRATFFGVKPVLLEFWEFSPRNYARWDWTHEQPEWTSKNLENSDLMSQQCDYSLLDIFVINSAQVSIYPVCVVSDLIDNVFTLAQSETDLYICPSW